MADGFDDLYDLVLEQNDNDDAIDDEASIDATTSDERVTESDYDADNSQGGTSNQASTMSQALVKASTSGAVSGAATRAKLPSGAERLASVKALVERAVAADGRSREVTAPGRAPRARYMHTVLTRMRACQEGPLGRLQAYVRDGVRIRVLVRGRAHLRAELRARLVAFDAHWNLALRDVDELYYRRRKRRVLRAGRDTDAPATMCYSCVQKHYRSTIELLQRHLTGMLLCGTHVLAVCRDSNDD